jgi:hypothetical protein
MMIIGAKTWLRICSSYLIKTRSLCVHTMTQLTNCVISAFLASSLSESERPPRRKTLETAIHIVHSSRAPHTVALGLCRHRRARTHAHVHPTDQGRCCGTAIAHVNQASLPESTHSGSHLIYLYKPPTPPGKTSPCVWLCVCVFYVWSITRGPAAASRPEGPFFRKGN